MQEILDYNQPETDNLKGRKYRPLALIIELVPFLLGVLGLLFSIASLTIISWTSLSMIYLAMSWYLFKGAKFEVGAIFYALFTGLVLSIMLLGILFGVMKWEGAYEMLVVAFTAALPAILVSVIWYFFRRKKYFEYTLSLKILSRLILGIIMMMLALNYASY